MAQKREPQSFAFILGDADGGTINEVLSARYEALRQELTDRASLHEDNFTGSFDLKIKLTVEGKSGKITWKVDAATKLPPQKVPGARFFTDTEGRQTRQDPRTAGALFDEKKSAAGPRAPKMASDQ